MTTVAAKKKPTEDALPHPLLAKPIPHAYALVQDPARPGKFFAVHLTDVIAKGVEILEHSDRSEPATYGLVKLAQAQERRHREKRWT